MTSLAGRLAFSAALAGWLAACGSARIIDAYPVAESPGTETADYPSLLDMPSPESARAAAPDPAAGDAVVADLAVEAAAQAAESDRLAAPVVEIAPLRDAAAAARRGR